MKDVTEIYDAKNVANKKPFREDFCFSFPRKKLIKICFWLCQLICDIFLKLFQS